MTTMVKRESLEGVIEIDTKANKLGAKVRHFISDNYAKIHVVNAATYLALTIATFTQPLPETFIPDYAAHIGVYAGLAATVERALNAVDTKFTDKFSPTIAFVSCYAIANGLEWYQSVLPERVANVTDVYSGGLGAAIGIFIWPVHDEFLQKTQIK
ncbi:MAG: VanZ family protein [Nanoarchaeota archaeon]